MDHIKVDLINVPDTVFNRMLRDKGEKPPEGKFQKIVEVLKVYKNSFDDIYPHVAEYLYAGQVPIEIRQIRSSQKIELNTAFLKKKFSDGYEKAWTGSLRPEPNENPQVNKIREIKTGKVLIQFVMLDRIIPIADGYDIKDLKKIKIVNSVIDTNKKILQVRADLSNSELCISFLEDLLKPFQFLKLNFDNLLIAKLREEKWLSGETYECKMKKRDEGDDESKIYYKTLKKRVSAFGELQEAVDFKKEIEEYEMTDDFFKFIYKHRSYNLQLTVDRSRIYFRKFAPESVIDYVLDKLLLCLKEMKIKTKVFKINT